MQEHLSEQMVERYRQRLLSTEELFAADDHLSACEACRQRTIEVEQPGKVWSALRVNLRAASAGASHLSYAQMAKFVDDRVGDVEREIVESHLKHCAVCVAEVDDLREFKSEIEARPANRKPLVLEPPTLWERLTSFWHWPVRWSPLQLGTAAALAVLFVTAATLFFVRRQERSTRGEVAQSSPVPIIEPSRQPTADESPTPSVAATPNPAVEIVTALSDGSRQVTLNKQGNMTGLELLSSSAQRAVRTALTTGRVETPSSLNVLSKKAGTLMGGADAGLAFQLLSPVGTVIRQDRPTLRWRPLSGATSYTVTVLDANYNVVATSPSLTVTEWKASRPLPRGGVYSWQVTALKEGQEITSPAAPAPEARFKVLEGAKLSGLEQAEAAYADSHLTRGVLYAQAGLLDDAERQFRALLKANPNSPVAHKLLQSVRTLRRTG